MAGKSAILSIRIVSDAKDAKKGFDKSTKAADKWAARLKKMTLAAGAAVGAFGLKTAKTFEDVRKTLQVSTGATGDQLDALVESTKNVGRIVPAQFDQIAESMATLNTHTGATGDELERLTQQVMNAARLLDEDATAAADSFGQALVQWGVSAEDGAKSLDFLYTLTQDYGVSLTGLTDDLTTYGSVLKNAGFTMDETADLFARMNQSGISLGRIMPGLNSAMRDWASEGKNIQDELSAAVVTIRDAENATEALAIATDVFGAEGAQRLTTAIREGIFSLDDLGDGMANAAGAIDEADQANRTLSESFDLLVNGAMVAIEPIATPIFEGLANMLGKVAGVVGDNRTAFTVLTGVLGGLAAVLLTIKIATTAWTTVMSAASAVTALMTSALWAKAAALIAATWPYLALAAAVAAVIAVVVWLYNEFEIVRNAVSVLGAVANTVFQVMTAPIRAVIDAVMAFIEAVSSGASPLDALKAAGTAAFDAFMAPINAVIDAVKSLIDWISNISFPSPPDWMTSLWPFSGPAEMVGIPRHDGILRFLPDPDLFAQADPRGVLAFDAPLPDLTAQAAAAQAIGSGTTAKKGPGPDGGNVSVNITVNGAIDPVGTARQIREILRREAALTGGSVSYAG